MLFGTGSAEIHTFDIPVTAKQLLISPDDHGSFVVRSSSDETVKPNDRLIAVNNETISKLTLYEALQGPKGSKTILPLVEEAGDGSERLLRGFVS